MIPCWVVREYLVKLGGVETVEGDLIGEGWRATCGPGPMATLGTWPVETVRVVFEGEVAALAPVLQGFDLKMLRGGG